MAELHWARQHNRALGLRPSLELEPMKALKMGPAVGHSELDCGDFWFVGTKRSTPVAEVHWARHNCALRARPSLELEPIKTLKMGPLLSMVSLTVGLDCSVSCSSDSLEA